MSASKLKKLVRSLSETMPLWILHDDVWLVRRLGPILQLILFNSSRWNSDVNPMQGFDWLGSGQTTVGIALGDTLRRSNGTQLWLPITAPTAEWLTLFHAQVLPDPKETLTWGAIKEVLDQSKLDDQSVVGLLLCFRTYLYLGETGCASRISDALYAAHPDSIDIDLMHEALRRPVGEVREEFNTEASDCIKRLKLPEGL